MGYSHPNQHLKRTLLGGGGGDHKKEYAVYARENDDNYGRPLKLLGPVVGVGRRIRLDEDSSSGLASLRTSELLLRIAGVRRNEAPRRNESPYSLRGHRHTAHA